MFSKAFYDLVKERNLPPHPTVQIRVESKRSNSKTRPPTYRVDEDKREPPSRKPEADNGTVKPHNVDNVNGDVKAKKTRTSNVTTPINNNGIGRELLRDATRQNGK
jgi:hypothetical protein